MPPTKKEGGKKKKGQAAAEVVVPPPPEWDPTTKEPWFLEFEKEPVNDDKWTCIVTAAIENEVQDEKCIQVYTQCVNTGLRKAVKIISRADVVRLLKGSSGGGGTSIKDTKSERMGQTSNPKLSGIGLQVLEMVTKYAAFTGSDFKLPVDLTAAILKVMILSLKEENCLLKKTTAVKDRKLREQRMKAKFIKELKPFEASQEEEKEGEVTVDEEVSSSLLGLEEPIDDEPFGGPDLYILLTGFYDALCFPELQAMNVPFSAVLKITTQTEPGEPALVSESNMAAKRSSVLLEFWRKLNEECFFARETSKFKEVLLLEYEAVWRSGEAKQNYRTLFQEMSWVQYSVYYILRQHEKYLLQLHVQKDILSLEPLDLFKCEVYSKLCDALITGEPNTPLLVLYAMVEQVVAGVPSTQFEVMEYEPKPIIMTSSSSSLSSTFDRPVVLVTPCLECRGKKSYCDKLKQEEELTETDGPREWVDAELSGEFIPFEREENWQLTQDSDTGSSGIRTFTSLISRVLSERKTEKENREDKRWKTPSLCFHGDSIFLQTYYCDPKIFDSETIVERFLKNSNIPQLWRNHPELKLEERAFYNFHTNCLRKISKESEEMLKIKMLFSIGMDCIAKAQAKAAEDEQECWLESAKPKLSEVNLNPSLISILKAREINFRNYFLKKFVLGNCLKRMGVREESLVSRLKSRGELDFSQHSFAPNTKASWLTPTVCGMWDKPDDDTSDEDRILGNFYSVLNCTEISSLAELGTFNAKDFQALIQNFKFYEKLDPDLMIQRLVEAQEHFNAMQYVYFAPTDSLIVVLLNDYDCRGIFCTSQRGVLPTPVCLQDFYRYVYPEIENWLVEEEAEHSEFVSQLMEKARAKQEKADAAFLSQLKRKFCSMSEEKRAEFLAEDVGDQPITVLEKELKELPNKPNFPIFRDVAPFVVSNFKDTRVEVEGRINEFHSPDGTHVRAVIDNWLGEPVQLLRLRIKRSNFSLYYNQYLGKPTENKFLLRTDSGVIFSFYKEGGCQYNMTASWPTGLIVKPVWHQDTGFYIKQNYIKHYRRGWDIEEEKCRCFLRSGHVIIFKTNGDYDILFGSGTRYNYYGSGSTPREEIYSTTGNVWRVRKKGPCRNKKQLITNHKVFIGVNPETGETFCKREDGAYWMLWPNGRLVTNFPDGTKITSTPYFELGEVNTDWTSEEMAHFRELETKVKSEQESRRSRSILRNSGSLRKNISSVFTGFVMVSCEYLIEHPKYSSVYYNPKEEPHVKVTMPEELSLHMDLDGNYEVQQGTNFFSVCELKTEFYRKCPECMEKSTAKIYLDSREILCKCVDFSQQGFLIFADGSMNYLKFYEDVDSTFTNEREGEQFDKYHDLSEECKAFHFKTSCLGQRCFTLERDLSGIEFLHTACLAHHFYDLPDNTHFDLNTDDPDNICHTSNSPVYKIGYEKWTMEYEESNSFPRSIKKKDMRELGAKQITRNSFKYPFPKHHNCGSQQSGEKINRDVQEPKVIVSRTLRCLSDDPKLVIGDLQFWVTDYQERAARIYDEYKNHKSVDDRSFDSRYMEMRLRKIALTLSQSLQMYPHLCTNFPSTEKDIHYFGHFINAMEGMRQGGHEHDSMLPSCKQIPERLPKISDFSSIQEEIESPGST